MKSKIILWYLIGIASLIGFYLLNTSEQVSIFMEKAERSRADWAFGTVATVGLIQYSLLIIGIAILTILTALLSKEVFTKN